MYPNLDSAEMEHSLARIDRVTDFIYEPPISTTIHLMEETGYLLYIDQDRVTLTERGSVAVPTQWETISQTVGTISKDMGFVSQRVGTDNRRWCYATYRSSSRM